MYFLLRKTNGFVLNFFSISGSCRQGCPVAPLIYILQPEPMACAIRGNNDIKGIKLPGEPGGKEVDNQVLDSDIIIEGFETPSRKNRDSRECGIITYHKSCVSMTRSLDLENEHVESMWYELKGKLRKKNIFLYVFPDV